MWQSRCKKYSSKVLGLIGPFGMVRGPPQPFTGNTAGGDSVDWTTFPAKFAQSAQKILAKMHSNALMIADNMKRTVEELSKRSR